MKINKLTQRVLTNRRRGRAALLAFLLLIGLGLTPGVAQLQDQKRITAVQIAEAAGGSRVTVFSDSALSDYEAFKRGDRFYVKIPFAEFTAAAPRFDGAGFEDVQVQKVGDSVIISFKLQPGATARVDQRSNRLDVLFSAPNIMPRSKSAIAASNRAPSSASSGIGGVNTPPTTQRPWHETSGPMPPVSPPAYRERLATGRAASERGMPERVATESVADDQTSQSATVQNTAPDESNKTGTNRSNTNDATKSDSPATSATLSTSTGHSALTTATPAFQRPASTPGQAGSRGLANSSKIPLQKASAIRVAILLGTLLLLGLLTFGVKSLYGRRKNAVKTRQVKTPLVQPRYSPDVELEDLLATGPPGSTTTSTISDELVSEYPFRPRQSEKSQPVPTVPSFASTGVIEEKFERSESMPAPAPSAGLATPQNHAWVLNRPSVGSAAAEHNESGSEDQEREVFEL